MGKDKYDFILELLTNKKLSQNQRERILMLSSKEIKHDKELGTIFEERINNLEEIPGIKKASPQNKDSEEFILTLDELDVILDPSNYNNESKEPNDASLPKKYLYPSGLYRFLLKYNKDPILKSTCHLIDGNELEKINSYCKTDDYDFEKHYSKILESYNNIEKLFAPTYIKALIRGYLTGKNYKGEKIASWSNDKIEWNWGHEILKEWCEKNNGIPPTPDEGIANTMENLGFEFDNPIKIKNEYLQLFGHLVLHFKKMFHIREDNSLLKILKTQNEFKKWNDKIDFQIEDSFFSEKVEIFTDVDKILQSYNVFIKLIIDFQKSEKPTVKLSLVEMEDSIHFSIHHINGEYGKTLIGAKSRLIGQKYEGIIKKLNGICDVYLQADFGQNIYAKIAIWNDKWNVQSEREELEIEHDFQGGVEHILEFKKK